MTGVERFAYNICQALANMKQEFTIICPHAPIQSCYDTSRFSIIKYGFGNSHFWEQCVLPFFFIGKKHFVVFSFTGLGSVLISNKVMTIHDLSFLENPKWFSKSYYWWYKLMTPLAVKTSRHLITVSEFSKKEILRFYPFIKEKDITIVYGAPDRHNFHAGVIGEKPSECFMLAVSSLDPRKNFKRLTEAFRHIHDCKLYIVGVTNRVFTQENMEKTESGNIHYLGRVTDEELQRLYSQAICFICPSIYEGFGLPAVEAMSCGCPVLASDIPVLKEVCGEAALYFSPFDTKDIISQIEAFIKLPDNDKRILQEKGLKHAERFAWDKSAKIIIDLIRKKFPC